MHEDFELSLSLYIYIFLQLLNLLEHALHSVSSANPAEETPKLTARWRQSKTREEKPHLSIEADPQHSVMNSWQRI